MSENQITPPAPSVIRDEFAVHLLNDVGIAKAKELAGLFSDFLSDLEVIVGGAPSRPMSIVRTHLQDASFWAKRAIAENTGNQK